MKRSADIFSVTGSTGLAGADQQRSATARPLTVTELTRKLRGILEGTFPSLLVEGEISGFKPAPSGHLYFSLKDDKAVISCMMWSSDAAQLSQPVRDGDKVEVRARITVYEARGQYQLQVQQIRPAGIGRLYQAFLDLKERLDKEGLFSSERKRPIPPFPRTVGVITSPSGAAVRDILNILARRAPHIRVLIFPARVQGAEAANEIVYAISRMNAMKLVDVLIVGRGGGSLEDLWPFNEEITARAVFRSDIPIISAVGHETDVTICDFVADLRAPTPSAAAEIVARSSAETLRELAHLRNRAVAAVQRRAQSLMPVRHMQRRLENAVLPRIELLRSHIRRFQTSRAVHRPLQRLNEMVQQVDDAVERMTAVLLQRQATALSRQQRLDAQLSALNPTSILQRGYSITFDKRTGEIVKSEKQVSPAQVLRIVVHDGRFDAVADPGATSRSRQQKRGVRGDAALEWFGTNPLSAIEELQDRRQS